MTEDQQNDIDCIVKPIKDHWGPICEAVAKETGWSCSEILLYQIYCGINNLVAQVRGPFSEEDIEKIRKLTDKSLKQMEEGDWKND